MNINPNAKRILCFGDSNTWGRVPGPDNFARYEADKRWTGVMQSMLGRDFEVIEEGLNGRTTDKESPEKAGKKGIDYLYSCLESQRPLDLVILALGKNELKKKYQQSPQEIVQGIDKCVEVVFEEGRNKDDKVPRILLIPPAIIEEKERIRNGEKVVDFEGGKEKSTKLIKLYKEVAKNKGLDYLDVSKIIEVSEIDGVHLDEKMHSKLGTILSQKVKDIFSRD